jgi:hypothetical protein
MLHRDMVKISVIFDSKVAYHRRLRCESVRGQTKPIFLKHAVDAELTRTIAASIFYQGWNRNY